MIHSTAIVDPDAKLGQDVTVGPFAYIEADVKIGDGCVIGPHASVLRYTTLGPCCRVHAGAVIGDVPQDAAFQNAESFVRVGAGCVIREGVTIHRGTKPGTATEIGEGCFLMAFSHCAHNVRLGPGVILANGALLGGYVEVGARAFISGNCLLHQFTRVGRLAMLGGGSGVSKDVPPFCTVRGLHVNRVAGLNVIGLRRAGVSPEQRGQIKEAFRLLYRAGLNVTQAVEKIEEIFATGPAREMSDFVKSAKRGICGREAEEAPDGEA